MLKYNVKINQTKLKQIFLSIQQEKLKTVGESMFLCIADGNVKFAAILKHNLTIKMKI